ncbi:MAG: hypothetical protein RIM23_19285 [Coleofasciculus sp. G3-WIS-01]|uniref:hypothetical protein n=1 Tax=Coleofasciculus sp. G3-WIS-01 TaxID=3069528 RepID=UPI0032FFCDF1
MHYSPLFVLLSLSLSFPLLSLSPANAQDTTEEPRFAQGFWRPAEQLVQEQLNLINRIEGAFYSPNVYQVEATRSQLFLHLGKVERFLKSQYQIPQFLCNNGTPDPDFPAPLTLPQRQVYCNLYVSTQKLKPMVELLDMRLPMLAGVAAPSLLPDEQRLGLRLNLATPLRPRFSPVPDFPKPEPPVLGMPTKRPTTDYQAPPLQPAIAPPEAITRTLLAAREQLLPILPAFPESARIIDPGVYSVIPTQSTLGLLPLEPQRYAEFLAQPNTGIARIFLAESYQPDPNKLQNRLISPLPQPFPLTAGVEPTTDYVPSLALEIENGNFTIPLQGLDYGFIVNLGDVSLAQLDANLKTIPTLTPEQRDLFLNYRPPNAVEALQIDQRRFYTGKDGIGFVPPLSPPAATGSEIALNNTYLVRLIQFQLPEAVLKGEPISRSQRRYLPEILNTPSSDVIVAFQPVHQRLDGSYTVLWRLLYQFPDPQIENLAEYVDLE